MTAIDDAILRQALDTNVALPRLGLVAWTSGNASVRDHASGLVAIKPSGVPYEALTTDQLVVVDVDGRVVHGALRPSSDTATHLYLYRQRPELGAVIHTHSTFATAWAANGMAIPPVLTSIADHFGGPVPCGGFADIGGEDIGREILRVAGHSPAVLLKNHGVFCFAGTAEDALRAAVMVEDVAKTTLLARILGTPDDMPEQAVRRVFDFHTTQYGQSRPA